MRLHATISHPHAPPRREAALQELVHTQALKDRLYVIVVTALVLATFALFAGYAVYHWPQWRAGAIGGFDTQVLPLPGDSPAAALATAPPPAPAVNRANLILTSMLIDAVIFVALGLYLRHEMNRKP